MSKIKFLVFLLVAVVAALLAGALWLSNRSPQKSAEIGGSFRLMSGDGKTVTDRDLHGKYLLIYFGYTYCPDVCPTALQQVAVALDDLGAKADRLQPVFITVDPARDTPEIIGEYARAFSPRLIGLTGTEADIKDVERKYRVYASPQQTGPGKNDYLVNHSSVLYLMNPDGKFIVNLRADLPGDKLAAQIAEYLPEK